MSMFGSCLMFKCSGHQSFSLSHFVIDARGGLHILDKFLGILNDVINGVPPPSSPALRWGDEVSRLPPHAIEALDENLIFNRFPDESDLKVPSNDSLPSCVSWHH